MIRFALAGLLFLIWQSSAQAAHIPPSALVKVCRFDSDQGRADCDAFLRGSIERLQTRAVEGESGCRKEPFGPADVQAFLQFTSTHMIPDSGEAFALAFNFWGSRPREIPCNTVPGFWTNGHLLELCRADNSAESPCKSYVSALLGVTQIEEILTKNRYFCPKGSATRSDEEVFDIFQTWVAADARRANQPAALGYVQALMAAYPC